jgi:hypothetical protein
MVVSRRFRPQFVVLGTTVAVLSGCADATPAPPRGSAGSTADPNQPPQPSARSASPPPATASCPTGALLAPGEGIAIDYVDFVMVGGTMFVSTPGLGPSAPQPSQLGPVVAHVRCSMLGSPTDRDEPPLVDGTAALLPVRAEILAVKGFPPECRLAAVVGTTVRLYLAQLLRSSRASPCPAGASTADLRCGPRPHSSASQGCGPRRHSRVRH